MSNSYSEALAEIVLALNNADIPATTEASQVQLPGALVVPGLMSFDHLDYETYSAEIDIYLVTRNNGSVQAMDDLEELLSKFRTVFEVLEVLPMALELSSVAGPDPAPCLKITLQTTISKD